MRHPIVYSVLGLVVVLSVTVSERALAPDPLAVWVQDANLRRQNVQSNLYATLTPGDPSDDVATLAYWSGRRRIRYTVPLGYYNAAIKVHRANPLTLFAVGRNTGGFSPGRLAKPSIQSGPENIRFTVNGDTVRMEVGFTVSVFSSYGIFRADHRWVTVEGPDDIKRFDRRLFETNQPVLVHMGRAGVISALLSYKDGEDLTWVPTYGLEHIPRHGHRAFPRRYRSLMGAVIFGVGDTAMEGYREVDPQALSVPYLDPNDRDAAPVERSVFDWRDHGILKGEIVRGFEPETSLAAAARQLRAIHFVEVCGGAFEQAFEAELETNP